MSSRLPIVDLTGAIIGQVFTADFSSFVKFNPMQMSIKAHLTLFNESGCGVSYTMRSSGHGDYLPAGAWTTIDIEPNDNAIDFSVIYILPNPPVSMINITYYAPGETVPPGYTLGNSPIGIGGTVQTSSIQTLSNEGSASQLAIDLGDTIFNQLVALYTDGHALWAIDVGGVKHQVLKVSLTGNPLQLGQAGDIAEILGELQIDQSLTLSAPFINNPSVVTQNGSISGSVKMYQVMQGVTKITIIVWNNYNDGGSTKTLVLPVAYTVGALCYTGGIGQSGTGGMYLTDVGVNHNMIIFTGLAAAGGSITTQGTLFQYSIAEYPNKFDSVNFPVTGGAAHTANAILIGS
jgi:hypothetical protein